MALSLLCAVRMTFAMLLAALTLAANAFAQSTPAAPPQPLAPTAFGQLETPQWIRLGVEHRGRLEGVSGAGFSEGREDLYWLNRFRVTTRLSIKPWLSAAIQAQDARVEGRNGPAAAAPFRDQFDLRIAHIDVGHIDRGSLAVRAGRQELVFGDQRLVGHAGWLNTSRSFDAIRAVYRQNVRIRIDAFAASVVTPEIDNFNRSGGGNYLFGAVTPLVVLPRGGVLEPYALIRHTRNQVSDTATVSTLTTSTTGVRLAGRLSSRTDYNVEAAIQRGSLGADNISAWAGHWAAGRTILRGQVTYRAFGEYNYASGDETPGDGRRGTFDHLYPTAHDKYGLADQVGWKNIHHLRTGFEARPHAKLNVATSYHSFWVASTRDALYNAGGAVIARVVGGVTKRHVGHELDVQATFTPSPRIQVHGGYAHIFTGPFLQSATPGKSYSAPFVMVTTMLIGMEK